MASKIYSRAFGTEISFPEIWFDFEIDTVYLNYGVRIELSTSDLSPIDCGKVRYLVLQIGTHAHHEFLASELREFPNVNEVTVRSGRGEFSFYLDDRADLVFTNLLPVENPAFRRFWVTNSDRYEDEDGAREWQIIRKIAEVWGQYGWVDITRLEKERVKLDKDVFMSSTRPTIQYQIVTTPVIKQKLLNIKADFDNWYEQEQESGEK